MATSKPASEIYTLLKLFAIIFIPLCVQGSPKDNVALFVFGDSLFDPGNNKYLNSSAALAYSNFWPYGETFFNHPTGRYSDGRIIPDFIANYMKLPLVPPYLQPGNREFMDGFNFGSGGAGALDETRPGIVVNLNTQLSHFKNVEKKMREQLGDVETKKLLSRAIYLFSIGSNDYFVRVLNSTVLRSFSREEYVGMVIGNLTNVIKEIYQREGRKFGIVNVAPLWLTPTGKVIFSDLASEEVAELVKLHNKALSKALKELKRDLKAFEYSEFDFYTSVSERISSPSKYGFKESKAACCGSGPYRGSATSCGRKGFELCENVYDYIFFDGIHPTDHANKQLAKLIWSGSSTITRPINLKTLVQIRPN